MTNKNTKSIEKPRLFQLWDEIVGGSEPGKDEDTGKITEVKKE